MVILSAPYKENKERFMDGTDIYKIDDLAFRLKCGVSLVSAIHDCLENGPCSQKDYSDALYGAYDYLCAVQEKLSAMGTGITEEINNTPVAVQEPGKEGEEQYDQHGTGKGRV